ncbi:MAG TPA: TMEM175 family protein, partial [Ktedonobacterales bacterium]|nr:TMEM175 family protein [Ktedonobacterales bacterium]
NQIAGANLERLAALSDGVFAIAMTLLVLDLKLSPTLPNGHAIRSEADLASALLLVAPRFIAYFMSFLTLGIFWIGQQTQLNHMARGTRALAWLHLGFLLAVTLMPFTTGLLADHITLRLALAGYWLNIVLLGAMLYITWRYALGRGLMKAEVTAPVRAAVERRILVAQALYAVGAALCLVDTRVSIAFIVLVQLNYVFAPRLGPLDRI